MFLKRPPQPEPPAATGFATQSMRPGEVYAAIYAQGEPPVILSRVDDEAYRAYHPVGGVTVFGEHGTIEAQVACLYSPKGGK